MADYEGEGGSRKRKFSDHGDEPAAKRAPPDASTDDKPNAVLVYQKAQLLLKVAEQRREIDASRARIEAHEAKARNHESELSVTRRHWNQLDTALELALRKLQPIEGALRLRTEKPRAARDGGASTFLQRLCDGQDVEHSLAARVTATGGLAERFSDTAVALFNRWETVIATMAAAGAAEVDAERARFGQLLQSVSTTFPDLERRAQEAIDANARADDVAASLREESKKYRMERDSFEEEHILVQRRCDRLTATLKENQEEMARLREAGGAAGVASSTAGGAAPVAAGAGASSAEVAALREKLRDLQGDLELRERDLLRAQEKEKSLLVKLTHLEDERNSRSLDDRAVTNHQLYRDLFKQCDHVTHELEMARTTLEAFQKLHTGVLEDHRRAIGDAAKAAKERQDQMTAEMKESESHNQRLRAERAELAAKLSQREGGNANTIAEYREMQASLEARNNQLKMEMERYKTVVPKLETDLASLRNMLVEHDEEDGTPQGVSAEVSHRMARIEKMNKELTESVNEHTQTNNMLVEEIEKISKAFEDMQRQNSNLLSIIKEKDDNNAKLLSSRIKGDQLAAALGQSRDQLQEKVKAVSAKCQTLEELNKALEMRNKSNDEQLMKLRDAEAILYRTGEERRRDASNLQIQTNHMQSQLTAAQNEIQEVKSEREKDVSYIYDLKRSESQLKDKVARLEARARERGERPDAEASAAAPSEDIKLYRKLLNCSVCQLRQKDVMIKKCSHTFCRECINKNLAARNRKCPGCGLLYGQDDVLPVYF